MTTVPVVSMYPHLLPSKMGNRIGLQAAESLLL